jgi:RNA polymerase sigma-70 factor (ECF subfamily)
VAERRNDEEPGERERWMAAAQRGDSAAYASLLTSILAPLRAFVRRRGVDDGEAEDVVQEVLLSIHRARHTWRADRPFDPWMWAIARNASIDALRRQMRDRGRRGPTAEDADLAGEIFETGPGPEELFLAGEVSPELSRALAGLPAAQREAVELLYVEQLSAAEAATRAGVTVSALKVRAHRGSRALRAMLRPEAER